MNRKGLKFTQYLLTALGVILGIALFYPENFKPPGYALGGAVVLAGILITVYYINKKTS